MNSDDNKNTRARKERVSYIYLFSGTCFLPSAFTTTTTLPDPLFLCLPAIKSPTTARHIPRNPGCRGKTEFRKQTRDRLRGSHRVASVSPWTTDEASEVLAWSWMLGHLHRRIILPPSVEANTPTAKLSGRKRSHDEGVDLITVVRLGRLA